MAGGQSIELVSITSIPHLQWLDGQLLRRAFLVPFQTVSARQSSKSKKKESIGLNIALGRASPIWRGVQITQNMSFLHGSGED